MSTSPGEPGASGLLVELGRGRWERGGWALVHRAPIALHSTRCLLPHFRPALGGRRPRRLGGGRVRAAARRAAGAPSGRRRPPGARQGRGRAGGRPGKGRHRQSAPRECRVDVSPPRPAVGAVGRPQPQIPPPCDCVVVASHWRRPGRASGGRWRVRSSEVRAHGAHPRPLPASPCARCGLAIESQGRGGRHRRAGRALRGRARRGPGLARRAARGVPSSLFAPAALPRPSAPGPSRALPLQSCLREVGEAGRAGGRSRARPHVGAPRPPPSPLAAPIFRARRTPMSAREFDQQGREASGRVGRRAGPRAAPPQRPHIWGACAHTHPLLPPQPWSQLVFASGVRTRLTARQTGRRGSRI